MRILIVEDNPKMRRLLRVFLQDAAEVFECANGFVAVGAFNECQPDWVVMDVQMKRVNGIIATRLLKTAYPSAQIVMLSKHDDAEIRLAAREAGACGYLVKDDLLALRRFVLETVLH